MAMQLKGVSNTGNTDDLQKKHQFRSGSTTMEKHGEFLDGGDFYHFHRAHETQVKSDENIAHAKYTDPAFFRASADEVAAEADARARIESSRYNYLSNRDRSEYGHKSRKHESNSRRFQSLVSADSSNRAAYYHYKANENASKRAYKNSKNQRKHERKMYKKKLRHEKSFWKK